MKSSSHIFALYVHDNYTFNKQSQEITLTNHDIINRINTILRLKIGETIQLFDKKIVYTCVIQTITKKNIICAVTAQEGIKQIAPTVHIMLPILQREAFENVVYMATVYGVQKINLIITEKSRKSVTEKDIERLQKIAIAAAEQSKQFCIPEIIPAVTFENFMHRVPEYTNYVKLACDIDGSPVLQAVQNKKFNYLITFGPEGDFAQQEKELLHSFTPVKLTTTVLRACDAANLIMGILRLQ